MTPNQQLKEFGFYVTGNPDEADHQYHYSEDLEDLLHRTFLEVQKKKPRTLAKLLDLVKKYDRVPAFRNYLSSYYKFRGKAEKAYEINRQIIEEFPDYLHGKLNLAAECLEKRQYDEIPKVLGEALNLKYLYPERQVFHITEYEHFNNIVCHYLLVTEQLDAVRSILESWKKVYPESVALLDIRDLLEEYEEIVADKRARARFIVEAAPQLHHPELKVLYEQDLDIDPQILPELLALPRPTLIEDLYTMIRTVTEKRDLYEEMLERDLLLEHDTGVLLHAYFMLWELKEENYLPLLISFLQKDDKYVDLWFGDLVFEDLWRLVYPLAEKDPERIYQLLVGPEGIYPTGVVLLQSLELLGLNQPDRLPEVQRLLERLLRFYIDLPEEEVARRMEMISTLVADLVTYPGGKDLLPLIEQLFQADRVELDVTGDLESVVHDMDRPYKPHHPVFYDNIFDLYASFQKFFRPMAKDEAVLLPNLALADKSQAVYDPESASPGYISPSRNEPAAQKPNIKNTPKVGRDDPCPCGSGKKYKKCCWGK